MYKTEWNKRKSKVREFVQLCISTHKLLTQCRNGEKFWSGCTAFLLWLTWRFTDDLFALKSVQQKRNAQISCAPLNDFFSKFTKKSQISVNLDICTFQMLFSQALINLFHFFLFFFGNLEKEIVVRLYNLPWMAKTSRELSFTLSGQTRIIWFVLVMSVAKWAGWNEQSSFHNQQLPKLIQQFATWHKKKKRTQVIKIHASRSFSFLQRVKMYSEVFSCSFVLVVVVDLLLATCSRAAPASSRALRVAAAQHTHHVHFDPEQSVDLPGECEWVKTEDNFAFRVASPPKDRKHTGIKDTLKHLVACEFRKFVHFWKSGTIWCSFPFCRREKLDPTNTPKLLMRRNTFSVVNYKKIMHFKRNKFVESSVCFHFLDRD